MKRIAKHLEALDLLFDVFDVAAEVPILFCLGQRVGGTGHRFLWPVMAWSGIADDKIRSSAPRQGEYSVEAAKNWVTVSEVAQ